MAAKKNLNYLIKNRITKMEKCTRTQMLNIVLEELVKYNKLRSCVVTDEDGLILAEVIHPRANREFLSAASGLGGEFIDRFSDILQIGKPHFNYLETPNSHVWIKKIVLPQTNDKLILLAIKNTSFTDKLSKKTLKLLGKAPVNMIESIDIVTSWIIKACID